MAKLTMVGKKVKMGGNTFDDKNYAVVWLAYTKKAFFEDLWTARKKAKQLRHVLENNGFKDDAALNGRELQRLKNSLNHSVVRVAPEKLMAELHKYTDPKTTIHSAWAEW